MFIKLRYDLTVFIVTKFRCVKSNNKSKFNSKAGLIWKTVATIKSMLAFHSKTLKSKNMILSVIFCEYEICPSH